MTPQPISYRRLINTTESYHHRHVDCDHYSDCTRYVMEQGWHGFTCRACEIFCNEFNLDINRDEAQMLLRKCSMRRHTKSGKGTQRTIKSLCPVVYEFLWQGFNVEEITEKLNYSSRYHIRHIMKLFCKLNDVDDIDRSYMRAALDYDNMHLIK